jgi:hypothetical protein
MGELLVGTEVGKAFISSPVTGVLALEVQPFTVQVALIE